MANINYGNHSRLYGYLYSMDFTFNFSIYIQFFIGLFALINPLGILPVFVSMTDTLYETEKRRTTMITCVSVGIILLISLFLGKAILEMFSISLSSFRIAGGILIVSIALAMISGKLGEHKQNKEEKAMSISDAGNIAVVPLAMPLMAGPGSISSTIVWGSRYDTLPDWIGFSVAIILFSFACYWLFRFGPVLVNSLGKTGSNVVTRIMGLILMALGIEIIVAGISNLFPGLLK